MLNCSCVPCFFGCSGSNSSIPLYEPYVLPAVLQGPSFQVSGWSISWQQWDLRISFNGREGLVLHSIGYKDTDQRGRRRPVVHRAAIAEMAVPYAGEHDATIQMYIQHATFQKATSLSLLPSLWHVFCGSTQITLLRMLKGMLP